MPTNRERAEELATDIIAGRMCESFLKLAERLEAALDEVSNDARIETADAIRARAKVTP